MKYAIICLVACALAAGAEARPKRSVLYSAPLVAAAPAVVASVPVVQHSTLVHSHPTTVVKTEQVQAGDHSSYSYSTEVKSQPHVLQHSHPVAAVSHTAHVVPSYAHYGYGHYAYPSAYAYSPFGHYVLGK